MRHTLNSTRRRSKRVADVTMQSWRTRTKTAIIRSRIRTMCTQRHDRACTASEGCRSCRVGSKNVGGIRMMEETRRQCEYPLVCETKLFYVVLYVLKIVSTDEMFWMFFFFARVTMLSKVVMVLIPVIATSPPRKCVDSTCILLSIIRNLSEPVSTWLFQG